jgi:hypothetical protein
MQRFAKAGDSIFNRIPDVCESELLEILHIRRREVGYTVVAQR